MFSKEQSVKFKKTRRRVSLAAALLLRPALLGANEDMVISALWARIKANERLHLAWCAGCSCWGLASCIAVLLSA